MATGRGLRVGTRTREAISIEFLFEPSLKIVTEYVDVLNLKLNDFSVPIKKAIQDVIIPSIKMGFRTQGRSEWKQLSAFTLEMRGRGLVRFHQPGGQGFRILDQTGNLKRGATSIRIWDITKTEGAIHNLPQKIWYGKMHQIGFSEGKLNTLEAPSTKNVISGSGYGKYGKTAAQIIAEQAAGKSGRSAPNVPARPFLVIYEEDDRKVKLTFGKWLDEQIAITLGKL